MVSEPDTERCVSLLAVSRRGVDTRRCASKDAGPQRGVDLRWSHANPIGGRKECQRGRWPQMGVDCDVSHWLGRRTITIYKGVETFS